MNGGTLVHGGSRSNLLGRFSVKCQTNCNALGIQVLGMGDGLTSHSR